MPSKEFLALLLKSKAAEASALEVGDGVEAGPKGGSKATVPVSKALEGGVSESTMPLVKEKDKKRHRDGGTSRTHHIKKHKEHAVLAVSGKDGSTLKASSNLSMPPAIAGCVPENSTTVGLRLCKDYVEKVNPDFAHFPLI